MSWSPRVVRLSMSAKQKKMQGYLNSLTVALNNLDLGQIDAIVRVLKSTKTRNSNIYIFGNGGSAATASHMANDLAKKSGLKAISLVDNISILTAWANDVAYSEVFRKQLETLLRPGDVVVVISASGESENVIKAASYASSQGNKLIVLTGFEPKNRLAKIADIAVVVQSHDYGIVEDIHLTLNHIISDSLFSLFV